MICFRKKANAKGWGADAVSVLMEFQKMDKRREDKFLKIYFSVPGIRYISANILLRARDKKIYLGEILIE